MSHLSVLQLDSPISYLLAVVLPVVDALFPLVPSETVIELGVATAGSADPRIALLVGLAATMSPTCSADDSGPRSADASSLAEASGIAR